MCTPGICQVHRQYFVANMDVFQHCCQRLSIPRRFQAACFYADRHHLAWHWNHRRLFWHRHRHRSYGLDHYRRHRRLLHGQGRQLLGSGRCGRCSHASVKWRIKKKEYRAAPEEGAIIEACGLVGIMRRVRFGMSEFGGGGSLGIYCRRRLTYFYSYCLYDLISFCVRTLHATQCGPGRVSCVTHISMT